MSHDLISSQISKAVCVSFRRNAFESDTHHAHSTLKAFKLHMGCFFSKHPSSGVLSARSNLSLPVKLQNFLPKKGPLSPAEYRGRLLSTDGEQKVVLEKAGLALRYAFVSQRGYEPFQPAHRHSTRSTRCKTRNNVQ